MNEQSSNEQKGIFHGNDILNDASLTLKSFTHSCVSWNHRRKIFHSYGLIIPIGYTIGATHYGLTANTASGILIVLLGIVLLWEFVRLYAPIFLASSPQNAASSSRDTRDTSAARSKDEYATLVSPAFRIHTTSSGHGHMQASAAGESAYTQTSPIPQSRADECQHACDN